MKLARFTHRNGQPAIGLLDDRSLTPLKAHSKIRTLADVLESADPAAVVQSLVEPSATIIPLAAAKLLAPIDEQEVWAAGVTYTRSKIARMEESVGAASFYDKVYEAPRPELFFKASPRRVSGPEEPVRIRRDATWNVPEPELALVLNSRMELVGYTIGNDMSSRDIEGENPLYLPQAKVYDQCCGLGPCVTLAADMPPREATGIRLRVERGGQTVFEGKTSVDRMARSFADLIEWLGRDQKFPAGVFLLTGTGVVPPDDFTLRALDRVTIEIDGIGALVNPVVQG